MAAPVCADTLMQPRPRYNVRADIDSTLEGLEAMRGESFLLADTMLVERVGDGVQTTILNPDTSPTNIAWDILIQTELASSGRMDAQRLAHNILNTLAELERHPSNGLFFSRYSSEDGRATDLAVSSIDNLHLALALWTLSKTLSGTVAAERASAIVSEMDFSDFVDARTSLVGGNLKPMGGSWRLEAYRFSHLGSEARALYSAGWALGLFRKHTGKEFIDQAMKSLTLEIYNSPEGPLMKLWDGSAFQLYFPRVLIGEEFYSDALNKVFKNMARYMVQEGHRRGLVSPAAHTAARAAVTESSARPAYQDKSGNKDLVSSFNRDLKDPKLATLWENLFSPHVIYMAALGNPDLLNVLNPLRNISSSQGSLYLTGLGWMDSLHVDGLSLGEVVPVQLSLNQGMLALTALALRGKTHISVSARALRRNRLAWSRLQYFYDQFDKKWAQECASGCTEH